MPHVVLRVNPQTPSENDLTVTVQDNTYEYLMTSDAPKIRVSAYLDRDWDQVESSYAVLFVSEDCPYESTIVRMTPGSRTRNKPTLPGAMKEGEQLVLEVTRTPLQPTE